MVHGKLFTFLRRSFFQLFYESFLPDHCRFQFAFHLLNEPFHPGADGDLKLLQFQKQNSWHLDLIWFDAARPTICRPTIAQLHHEMHITKSD